MKNLFKIFIASASLLSMISCGESSNRFKSAKAETTVEAEIIRMDKDIYELDDCITKPAKLGNYDLMTADIPDADSVCLDQKLIGLQEKYQDKFFLYLRQLGAMTGVMSIRPATLFYLFLSHPAYHDLFADCEKEYENVDDLQQGFSKAFSRTKTLIPDFNVPKVCTYFSGFAEYIAADSSTVYVSLEYFLGADYKNYQYVPGIYDYMIPNLRREKIVPDALYHWLCSEYQLQKEAGNLLDNMIHYGKILYAMEAILPETSMQTIIGYNQEQWEWCENNEPQMWNYLRQYNQLFSTDSKVISDYLFPANCTKYFSTEENQAPAQAVLWLGWRIVSQFMKENKEVSLNDLLTNNQDAQEILQLSNYRP